MGPFAVMCCGCLRLLGKSGRPIGEKSADPGVVNVQELGKRLAALDSGAYASFESKQAADECAIANGWSTTDLEGRSNHRCPDCRFVTSAVVERRGAFIEL